MKLSARLYLFLLLIIFAGCAGIDTTEFDTNNLQEYSYTLNEQQCSYESNEGNDACFRFAGNNNCINLQFKPAINPDGTFNFHIYNPDSGTWGDIRAEITIEHDVGPNGAQFSFAWGPSNCRAGGTLPFPQCEECPGNGFKLTNKNGIFNPSGKTCFKYDVRSNNAGNQCGGNYLNQIFCIEPKLTVPTTKPDLNPTSSVPRSKSTPFLRLPTATPTRKQIPSTTPKIIQDAFKTAESNSIQVFENCENLKFSAGLKEDGSWNFTVKYPTDKNGAWGDITFDLNITYPASPNYGLHGPFQIINSNLPANGNLILPLSSHKLQPWPPSGPVTFTLLKFSSNPANKQCQQKYGGTIILNPPGQNIAISSATPTVTQATTKRQCEAAPSYTGFHCNHPEADSYTQDKCTKSGGKCCDFYILNEDCKECAYKLWVNDGGKCK